MAQNILVLSSGSSEQSLLFIHLFDVCATQDNAPTLKYVSLLPFTSITRRTVWDLVIFAELVVLAHDTKVLPIWIDGISHFPYI